jgi:hypothetical protein
VRFLKLLLYWNVWKQFAQNKCFKVFRRKGKIGGARRNRTADEGFADLCLTTWRPRPFHKEPICREPNSSHTRGAFQPKVNDWQNYNINSAPGFDANLRIIAEKQLMSSETPNEGMRYPARDLPFAAGSHL